MGWIAAGGRVSFAITVKVYKSWVRLIRYSTALLYCVLPHKVEATLEIEPQRFVGRYPYTSAPACGEKLMMMVGKRRVRRTEWRRCAMGRVCRIQVSCDGRGVNGVIYSARTLHTLCSDDATPPACSFQYAQRDAASGLSTRYSPVITAGWWSKWCW